MNKKTIIICVFTLALLSCNALAHKEIVANITSITLVDNRSMIINATFTLNNTGNETIRNINTTIGLSGFVYKELIPELDVNEVWSGEYTFPINRSSMTNVLYILAKPENLSEDEFVYGFSGKRIYVWWFGVNLYTTLEVMKKNIYVNETVPMRLVIENHGLSNATNITVNITLNGIPFSFERIPLLESIYYNNQSRIVRNIDFMPNESRVYTMKVEVKNSNETIEYYEPDNTATVVIIPERVITCNIGIDSPLEVAVKINGFYESPETLSEGIITGTDKHPISILSLSTLDEILFENSIAKENMNIKFENIGDIVDSGIELYNVYAFGINWQYDGINIEYNEYPNKDLVVMGCRSWNWAQNTCNGEWEFLNTTYGSIIGNGVGMFEALGLSPKQWVCGDGVCESDVGETADNCPEDCEQIFQWICGDGVCDTDAGENVDNCPEDCQQQPQQPPVITTVPSPGGGGGGGAPSTISLPPDEKEIVGGDVVNKTETEIECVNEGEKWCEQGELHICKNNKIIIYDCLYGCEVDKCIMLQPTEGEEIIEETPVPISDMVWFAGIIITITVTILYIGLKKWR